MESLNPEIIKVVKEAIRLEVKGRNFFLHAAETTTNELGRKMFERLAAEEVEHMKAFADMFTSTTGGEEWKKFVRSEEQEVSAVVEELKKRMEGAEKEKGAGDLEAMRIGMELERRAIEFFTELAAGSRSEEARGIAERICDQERGHYDLLQAQYDSVHNSGFWFDSAEFRLDGIY